MINTTKRNKIATSQMLVHKGSTTEKQAGALADLTNYKNEKLLKKRNKKSYESKFFFFTNNSSIIDDSEQSQQLKTDYNKTMATTIPKKNLITASLTSRDSAELDVLNIPIIYKRSIGYESKISEKKVLRGKERSRVHSFFKELRLSNSISNLWSVNKEKKEPDMEPIIEDDCEQLQFTNLKEYLSPKPAEFKVIKPKFSRVSLKDLGAQLSNFQLNIVDDDVNSSTSEQSQHVSETPKATMASTNSKLVTAPSVASVSAATDALNIPMLSEQDFVENVQIFEAFGLSVGLASVADKYVSVNVIESQKKLAKQFFSLNKLTILNTQRVVIFVPKRTVKIQFLVTRKPKAPQPPKIAQAVEHGTTISTKQVDISPKLTPISNKNSPIKFTEKPRDNGNYLNKATLDKWLKLSPDQVKQARKEQVNSATKHKETVLKSFVSPSTSFAATMQGVSPVKTKITFSPEPERKRVKVEKVKIPEKLPGIPYPLWVQIWSRTDLISAYYKKLYRTKFFSYRQRWNTHCAICIKTKKPLEMNPYLVDFNYMWKFIESESSDLKDRFASIVSWEQKVINFYPKTAFNADWFKTNKNV